MNAEDVILEVSHLEKSFGSHDVLRDISFQVAKGDVVSVIGASGSGKSTMLRCVNLLETPTGGSILYHGEDITDPKINVPAYRSKVGMVFQSFNLFNNMTVLELHGRSDQGSWKKKRRSRRKSNGILKKGWHGRVHQCKTASTFRWSETACGNCKGFGNGAGNPAF